MSSKNALPAPPVAFEFDHPALFLDLDGTLAGIEARPELVELPNALIAMLDRLATALDGALAILSGRSIDQIDALLSPLRVPAAGLHGGDLRLPTGRRFRFEPSPQLRGMVRGACMTLPLAPGAWLEDKAGICFALHYRDAPAAGDGLVEEAERIAARTHGRYTVQRGKCVVELKPEGWDKGTSVRRLMETKPFLNRTPIAVGDDLTDEHAFAECHLWDGFAISVGDREPTCADYRLEAPANVHAWLARLTAALEGRISNERSRRGMAHER